MQKNKKMYICFLMAFAMLAASPIYAADVTAPVQPGRTALVVRADPRTGRLVRAVVQNPSANHGTASSRKASANTANSKMAVKSIAPPREISDLVEQSARAHNVDPLLVKSVIKAESNYNPYAVSYKGAEGLMQLMPPTARMLGVANSFDPRENIEAGVKYLKYLQDLYGDDRLALAAYNAGPENVAKYKQIPPFKQTQDYVEQVGRDYEHARLASKKAPADQAQADEQKSAAGRITAPVVERHPKLEQSIDEHGRLSLRTVE